jgi:hypothetical protein
MLSACASVGELFVESRPDVARLFGRVADPFVRPRMTTLEVLELQDLYYTHAVALIGLDKTGKQFWKSIA